MKILLALSASAAILCACADTGPTQYAANDCKVAPVVTTGPNQQARVSHLDQRYAQMQLATSDFRLRELQRNPAYSQNNIEQSLSDCAKK